MKRKNLLNESQVRKFMKLANIDNDMANVFLAEGLETQGGNKDKTAVKTDANIVPKGSRWLKEQEDEEGEEVLDDFAGDEGPVDDAALDDVALDDEAVEPGGEVTLTHDDAVNLIQAVVGELAGELGLGAATVTTGDEEAVEEPAVDDFDAIPADEEGVDLDADLEVMDEDEIVSETLRRVTLRLNSANEEKKIVNEAMRRIQTRYGRSTK